jgi:hypothetical protein
MHHRVLYRDGLLLANDTRNCAARKVMVICLCQRRRPHAFPCKALLAIPEHEHM